MSLFAVLSPSLATTRIVMAGNVERLAMKRRLTSHLCVCAAIAELIALTQLNRIHLPTKTSTATISKLVRT